MSAELGIGIAVVVLLLVGLVGIVVPVVPGLALIVAAQLVWALFNATPLGWVSFALGLLMTIAAWVLMYYLPGKQLKAAGIPTWVLAIAAIAGIIGFFVIPVVGLPLFFVVAVYAVESIRQRHATTSLGSTWQAIKAAGLSLLIELTAGMVSISQWILFRVIDTVA